MVGAGTESGHPSALRCLRPARTASARATCPSKAGWKPSLNRWSSSSPVGFRAWKYRLAVDQDRVASGGDLAVSVLERGQAAHWMAVEIACGDVVFVGFSVQPVGFEPLREAEVRFGEARVAGDQGLVGGGARAGSAVSSLRAASKSRAKTSRRARGVFGGRTDRSGSYPTSLPGGGTRTGTAPIRSQ